MWLIMLWWDAKFELYDVNSVSSEMEYKSVETYVNMYYNVDIVILKDGLWF